MSLSVMSTMFTVMQSEAASCIITNTSTQPCGHWGWIIAVPCRTLLQCTGAEDQCDTQTQDKGLTHKRPTEVIPHSTINCIARVFNYCWNRRLIYVTPKHGSTAAPGQTVRSLHFSATFHSFTHRTVPLSF